MRSLDGMSIIEANNKSFPILKSDGTTLYLTRDVAGIFDRFEKYKFDEMFYVVENGQHEHFNSLIGISKLLHFPRADHLRHIKFGHYSSSEYKKWIECGNSVFTTARSIVNKNTTSTTSVRRCKKCRFIKLLLENYCIIEVTAFMEILSEWRANTLLSVH